MKKVIIIQARMTSTRLPGKILAEVAGKPMLAQQIRRLKTCRMVDEIVLATTVNQTDDAVAELAGRENVSCFRGDEYDVLSRFVGAATEAKADVVVRITGDCPLIDPEIVDKVIAELINNRSEYDYVSNVQKRTFPRGLDTEALFLDTLLRINRLGVSEQAREHVTIALRSEKPHLFLIRGIEDDEDNSDLRLTVDAAPDLELIRRIYNELDLNFRVSSYREIVAHLRAHPELIAINQGIETWNPTIANNI